jgi:uncharacterized membrane protein
VEGAYHAASTIRAAMINRPRQDLYAFWRDFTNLPSFAENVKAVEILDGGRSQWTIAGPAGAEIDLVSAKSPRTFPASGSPGAQPRARDVDHEGWIAFKDNAFGRGTEVRIFISYDPPAGAIGKVVAKVMQREPRIQARRELRRFKQLMETGEVSTSKAPDAAPRGKPSLLIPGSPAHPLNSESPMRALTWHGKHNVQVDTVPDPQIVNPRDAIIKITATAICGSDLHLYDSVIPGMSNGDILGHEFMGEVVESRPWQHEPSRSARRSSCPS